MALTPSTTPLVWIDCEMTGLSPTTNTILSISCFVTTHDLIILDSTGYHATIFTPPATLFAMDDWCTTTHTRTGLITTCLNSSVSISAEQAASELLVYVQKWVPKKGTGLLAGNSVHADKGFLVREPWGKVMDWLHYRILDVSAIKEGVRRWCGEGVLEGVPRKKGVHSAREDVLESIEEARYYMKLFRCLGSSGNAERGA